MSLKEYTYPNTYEEAVERKNYLLEKINEYNEALLLDNPLPLSEEEINDYQEEYQLLNDHLKLTENEKLAKLDDKDKVVNEDGTITKKRSIFDKINVFLFIYCFLGTIALGISYFLIKNIGYSMFIKVVVNYFSDIIEKYQSYTLPSDAIMNGFVYYLKLVLSYSWLPLAMLLVSVIVSIFFIRKKDINKQVATWMLISHAFLCVLSIALVLLIEAIPFWKELYDNIEDVYSNYVYSLMQG